MGKSHHHYIPAHVHTQTHTYKHMSTYTLTHYVKAAIKSVSMLSWQVIVNSSVEFAIREVQKFSPAWRKETWSHENLYFKPGANKG